MMSFLKAGYGYGRDEEGGGGSLEGLWRSRWVLLGRYILGNLFYFIFILSWPSEVVCHSKFRTLGMHWRFIFFCKSDTESSSSVQSFPSRILSFYLDMISPAETQPSVPSKSYFGNALRIYFFCKKRYRNLIKCPILPISYTELLSWHDLVRTFHSK